MPKTKMIHVHKAYSINNDIIPTVINIIKETPIKYSLNEFNDMAHKDAQQIAKALIDTLPQCTIDKLLNELIIGLSVWDDTSWAYRRMQRIQEKQNKEKQK